MDLQKIIASYWNIRSSTYTNGVNGFDEEGEKSCLETNI